MQTVILAATVATTDSGTKAVAQLLPQGIGHSGTQHDTMTLAWSNSPSEACNYKEPDQSIPAWG